MTKEIRKLNALLRRELGDQKLYSWRRNDELTHVARAVDPDSGSPMVDFKCDCGLNKNVHQPGCRMSVAVPKFFVTMLRPDKRPDQWALCLHIPPPPEHEWDQSVGTMLPYPRSGSWWPCDPVWLDSGILPDEVLTAEAINCIRRERQNTLAMRMEAEQSAMTKREANNKQNLRSEIEEDCYMPFGSLPGAKDTASYGGTKDLFKENYEHSSSSVDA